jgi:hypothetical protein
MENQQVDQLEVNEIVDHAHYLSDVLSLLMCHTSADVRKSVVFLLVEIHALIKDDD